jgi:drug/metabolite transporter (DMT)-like permease
MSEPDVVLPHATSASPAPTSHPRGGLSFAEWMLVIATAIWGMSFALAKGAGEAVNAAATDAAGNHPRALGPIAVLALRFTLATIGWLAIVPLSRRGWTGRGVRRGGFVGAFLAAGLILQHIALDHSTEAVTAFLTSLTVVFVPLILWLFFKQALPAAAWVGVAIALPGVWLMSDAGAAGGFRLGVGELLGIGCAIVFAWHLPLVNSAAPAETPYRMAAAQFATVGVACWVATLICVAAIGVTHFEWSVLVHRDVWLNVILLVAFPTLVSFGLANIYQPRVEPVRAVLIYLLEPVFAAGFAWIWNGRLMTSGMIAGGMLILAANAMVELWPMVVKRRRPESH